MRDRPAGPASPGSAEASGAERSGSGPKMYDGLADWWPVLSAPEDYGEEARFYHRALTEAARIPVREILELGSGGGNNASHLKRHARLTLVEPSARMLDVSRALNPECEHVTGDMRTVRLGRTFDAVFVHDAICYMTTVDDLRRAIETAWIHTRPEGAALFAPDHVLETFRETTRHGGHTRGDRALRYLEWSWDPDPSDSTYTVEYALLLREGAGDVRVEHDRHVEGLFARSTWLGLLESVGFEARAIPFVHSEVEPGSTEVFLCRRPAGGRSGARP